MTKTLDLTKLDLMDALDLAILIEQEAMERYEELTAVMREHRTEEAASFFHFMAKAEAKHGADLLTERVKLFGKSPRRVDRYLHTTPAQCVRDDASIRVASRDTAGTARSPLKRTLLQTRCWLMTSASPTTSSAKIVTMHENGSRQRR